MAREIADEYTSSLADLTLNSKPLINMLTMLAEDNIQHSQVIVEAVENHLEKVRSEFKLPVLYLIDSIVKNVGRDYKQLFTQNIVNSFCSVFEKVDEKVRAQMFKLRQTWNEVFPAKKLYALDVRVQCIDPAWPITALPPTPNIHVNPRFFTKPPISTTVPSQTAPTAALAKTTSVSNVSVPILDPKTLDMQSQVINKQKELLELRQKKLELELLQAKAKLEEQQKALEKQSIHITKTPQQLLLKPEVAKQLAQSSTLSGVKLEENKNSSQAVIKQQGPASLTTGPRIAPVNPGLIASLRPAVRDPRLAGKAPPPSIVEHNYKQKNPQKSPTKDITITDSKISTVNKAHTSIKRNDPRLHKSNKTFKVKDTNVTKTSPNSSPTKKNPQKRSLTQKSDKKSDERSPKKKSDSVSPRKHKKNEKRSRDRLDKCESDSVPSSGSLVNQSSPERVFKDLKGSTKNRNYIRRNRNVSVSPEPQQDVDLRVGVPPEKQPRIQEDSPTKNTLEESPSNKDVDLRTLVVPAPISKKRTSTENLEQSPAKKSKTEMFDVLFGNEDVDLRQLPMSQPSVPEPAVQLPAPATPQRPPTPPPPIISTSRDSDNEKKTKEGKDAHFEALRAKLANATKMSEKETKPAEDTDMRQKQSIFGTDDLTKIIISKADEQSIKTGNLSQALVEKVLTIFETQKLKEAQRRESEKSDFGNISLTPISDDELSPDFSHSSESEDDKPRRREKRIPPPAPIISKQKEYNNVNENTGNWGTQRRIRKRPSLWNKPTGPPEPWIRPPAVLNPQMYPRPYPIIRHPINALRPEIIAQNGPLQDIRTYEHQTNGELPNADPLVLEYIEKDTMRTINIDGKPREIRFYDETAVVIMSWDDPREISFQNGTRLITFDDKESFTLAFNDTYKNVTINGIEHRIKLGAPTRELYIDDKWYECFFGGPGIGIEIDGKMHVVKMDGPPPHVKIGTVKRTDLVAGKINLIINARQMVPVFLDSKPQKFDIEGKLHTLRFVDSLRTVLINEQPFQVEFGGLPKPITVHDKKHFIRFSVLPRGIKPGFINIHKMEGERVNVPEIETVPVENVPAPNEPALPMIGKRKIQTVEREGSPDNGKNSPIQQIGNFGLDVLSSIITSPMAASNNTNGYQIDVDTNIQDSQDSFPIVNKPIDSIPGLLEDKTPPVINPLNFMPVNLNINELFQKLVATGIVTSVKENSPQPVRMDDHDNGIKPVLFTQPETLKVRQPTLVANLFTGMQCSSCGVRFPPENSMQYSQHLDWHFRQNRRGKNSARKALCRKWYYNVDDWKNFEEIEDLEEREKNWFESQQQQQQIEGTNEENDEEIEIPSVPADSKQNERCEVCHDKFDQFYNEEKEEWHLRMAIRVEDKTYHPLCYEDHQASLTLHSSTLDQTVSSETETKNDSTIEKTEDIDESKEETKSDDDVVEVIVEEEAKNGEQVDDFDDDVQILPETVEQIIIDDNDDMEDSKLENGNGETDDITDKTPTEEEVAIVLQNLKSEPYDDEVPIVSISQSQVDNTQAEVVSSIDGNVQLESGPQVTGTTKIKINITKPIMSLPPVKEKETAQPQPEPEMPLPILEPVQDNDEPLPPGEEPIQLNLKPALQGLKLTRQPTVMKGTELTGMCSIM